MARPTLIDNGVTGLPTGHPFNFDAPFVVAAQTNYGTINHLEAFYFQHAILLAKNLTESEYDGMRSIHIQVWDQDGRVAIDLQRVNPTSFAVRYHPDLAFRFR